MVQCAGCYQALKLNVMSCAAGMTPPIITGIYCFVCHRGKLSGGKHEDI